jgi:predicted RND superfamily exporter protein
MINRLVNFILRYHRWLIAISIILTIILAYWFAQLKIGSAYTGILPPESAPERVFLREVRKDFGSSNPFIIAILHDDIFSHATLSKIQRLTSEIEKLPEVENIHSLTNASIIKSEHDEIYLKTISDDIPSTKKELDQFRQDILSNPLYVNNLITEDLQTTIITANISGSCGPQDTIRSTIERARDMALEMAGPEVIYVDGTASLSVELFQMIAKDVSTYLPLALLIVVIIILAVFRRWWVALLSLLSVVMSLICTYAIMSIAGIPLFALTATLPPIVAALGISYSIHLFSEYSRHAPRLGGSKKAVDRTLKGILLAVWLSAITTAIGFGSIALVYIVAIRKLGLFLVLGVVFLLLFITFFIPPALILCRPISSPPTPGNYHDHCDRSLWHHWDLSTPC